MQVLWKSMVGSDVFPIEPGLFFKGTFVHFRGVYPSEFNFSWCQQPLSCNGQVILAVQCLLVNMLVLNPQMRVINLHLAGFSFTIPRDWFTRSQAVIFFTPRYEAEHLPKRKGETKMGPMGCWWWFFKRNISIPEGKSRPKFKIDIFSIFVDFSFQIFWYTFCDDPSLWFFLVFQAQLVVNWWFGARWFGFLGCPKMKGIGILRGIPFASQTTRLQTNNPSLVETILPKRWKLLGESPNLP